jgi:hypothetical protein
MVVDGTGLEEIEISDTLHAARATLWQTASYCFDNLSSVPGCHDNLALLPIWQKHCVCFDTHHAARLSTPSPVDIDQAGVTDWP